MTPSRFDRLAARTRLSDDGRAVARAVLVDGRRAADVAREHGISRAAVHYKCRSVLRARAGHYPADWITVVVTVPPSVARQVRRIAATSAKVHRMTAGGRRPKPEE